MSSLVAEVEMDGEPEFGIQRDDKSRRPACAATNPTSTEAEQRWRRDAARLCPYRPLDSGFSTWDRKWRK
jgi:hypothetical protein